MTTTEQTFREGQKVKSKITLKPPMVAKGQIGTIGSVSGFQHPEWGTKYLVVFGKVPHWFYHDELEEAQ